MSRIPLPSESSFVYSRYIESTVDGLSYAQNHPERASFLHSLSASCESTGYEVRQLMDLVDFIEEPINTKRDYPSETFEYLGLDGIEPGTGVATFKTVHGRDVLSTSCRFLKGQLLFSGLRPYLNKVHLVCEDEGIGSSELIVMQPNSSLVNSEFLLAYLLSRLTLTQNHWVLTGSSYPRLSEDDLGKLMVILPDLRHQERVLASSGVQQGTRIGRKSTEDIIDECSDILLRRLKIDVSEPSRRYFFRTGTNGQSEYFSMYLPEDSDRFHHFFHHPKLGALDGLTQVYSVTSLDKILAEPIVKGVQPEYSEEGITVIKTANLLNRSIDYENALATSPEFFARCSERNPEVVLRKGDILVSSTGYVSLGKVDIYDEQTPAIPSVDILVLRPRPEYSTSFLVHFLRSPLGQLQFERWWSGSSGQIHVYERDLSQFMFPDSSETGISSKRQTEIAEEIDGHLNLSLEEQRQEAEKWNASMASFERLLLGESSLTDQ